MVDLREAQYQDFLPLGILTPADFYARQGDWSRAGNLLDEAETFAFRSGTKFYQTLSLLLRARLHFIGGGNGRARADLDEASEIAERGSMRLFMADIHLTRARLFHGLTPYPWKSPKDDLAQARKLIEQCGYWRRKEELEDAEDAAKKWDCPHGFSAQPKR